jgi:hypothetical protein
MTAAAATLTQVAAVRLSLGAHEPAKRQKAGLGAGVPAEPGFVLHELPLLRSRALLARNSGDMLGYQQFLARFREKALAADFEGYLTQADAMA